MKKTLLIHIGGRHFHMDEDGYHSLGNYLDALRNHFAPEGETGKEIVEDIEQRIAELLENKITPAKQSVSVADVRDIIGILGTVENFTYQDQPDEQTENDGYNRKDHRRLFRDSEHNYLGGVAAGLGEYFDIDPLWMRLAFIGLSFLHGLGVIIYAVLWIVVPKARTTAEKLQMKGMPVNLSTIRESVNAEYHKVKSNFSNLSKSPAANRTRSILEKIVAIIGLIIVAVFKFFIWTMGVLFLLMGSVFLAVLVVLLLGVTNLFGYIPLWNGFDIHHITHFFMTSGYYYLAIVSLIILVLIPIVVLIYLGIKIIFNIKTRHPVLRVFTFTAWLLSLIVFITLLLLSSPNQPIGASITRSDVVSTGKNPRIYLAIQDNTESTRITHYGVFGYQFNYSEWDEALYDKAELSIIPSEDDQMHVTVVREIKNVGLKNTQDYLNQIDYGWQQKDSVIYLDQYFRTDAEDFWMFANVKIKVRVPDSQVIVISPEICSLLEEVQRDQYCNDSSMVNKRIMIKADGDWTADLQNNPVTGKK